MTFKVRHPVGSFPPPQAPRVLVPDPFIIVVRLPDILERRVLLVRDGVEEQHLIIAIGIKGVVPVEHGDR